MAKGGDYAVGYGKPPKHSRFKKGQSGNPSGKKTGGRTLAGDLEDELQETVQVVEGGRRRTLTKQQVVIKSVIAKAAKGDVRAAGKIFDMTIQFRQGARDGEGADILDPDDEAIIAAFEARHHQGDKGVDDV